jgi:hypothetical protein
MLLAIRFIAAGQGSWTPDADVSLVGFYMMATSGIASLVVSEDPSLTVASVIAASNHLTDKLIVMGSSNNTAPTPYTPLSFQLGKGQTVYFSADSDVIGFLFYLPTQL